MRKIFYIIIGAVIAGVACAAPAWAANYTFKFAHSQPESSVRHKSMLLFKEKLEKESGGRIKVEVFSGSMLGSEPEVMDMVKMGSLQGTRGGAFTKANKKFLIYTLPFLFSDTDSVLKAMRSSFGDDIARQAEVNGYYIPATGVAGGFRQVSNSKRPINIPDDMVGLKIRTPPIETIVKTMQVLGANPTSVPYGETYMALKMGVVDGQENPPSNIVEMKFYETQKYLSLVGYQIHPDPFVVNLQWYRALPADLKVIFNKAAKEAMEWSDTNWLASESRYLETLKKNMTVNAITPENRAKFLAKVKPVWDSYVKDGTFTEAEIQAAIKASK
jgi:tripartite ATP-independent transporter DctP family solute receptor